VLTSVGGGVRVVSWGREGGGLVPGETTVGSECEGNEEVLWLGDDGRFRIYI
jgi:hypothetical protein